MSRLKLIFGIMLAVAALQAGEALIQFVNHNENPTDRLIEAIDKEAEKVKLAFAQAHLEEEEKRAKALNESRKKLKGSSVTIKTKKEHHKNPRTGKISSYVVDEKVVITLDDEFFKNNKKLKFRTGNKNGGTISLAYKKDELSKKSDHTNRKIAKRLQLLQEDESIALAEVEKEPRVEQIQPAIEPSEKKLHYISPEPLRNQESNKPYEVIVGEEPPKREEPQIEKEALPPVEKQTRASQDFYTWDEEACPNTCCQTGCYSEPRGCFLPTLFTVGYAFGKGIDTHKSYGFASLMMYPLAKRYDYAPFLYVQANALSNHKWAGNFGAGLRIDWIEGWIWGFNLFYDTYRGHYGSFHQVGAGYELLSDTWEVRANVYFPVHQECQSGKERTYYYPGDYYIRLKGFECAQRGFDFEFGRNFCINRCWNTYFGVGPACFKYPNTSHRKWAFKARGVLEWNDYLAFEVRTYKEGSRNWQWQGVVSLTIPFETLRDCCECGFTSLFERPIYRNSIIKTNDGCCWKTNY